MKPSIFATSWYSMGFNRMVVVQHILRCFPSLPAKRGESWKEGPRKKDKIVQSYGLTPLTIHRASGVVDFPALDDPCYLSLGRDEIKSVYSGVDFKLELGVRRIGKGHSKSVPCFEQ